MRACLCRRSRRRSRASLTAETDTTDDGTTGIPRGIADRDQHAVRGCLAMRPDGLRRIPPPQRPCGADATAEPAACPATALAQGSVASRDRFGHRGPRTPATNRRPLDRGRRCRGTERRRLDHRSAGGNRSGPLPRRVFRRRRPLAANRRRRRLPPGCARPLDRIVGRQGRCRCAGGVSIPFRSGPLVFHPHRYDSGHRRFRQGRSPLSGPQPPPRGILVPTTVIARGCARVAHSNDTAPPVRRSASPKLHRSDRPLTRSPARGRDRC